MKKAKASDILESANPFFSCEEFAVEKSDGMRESVITTQKKSDAIAEAALKVKWPDNFFVCNTPRELRRIYDIVKEDGTLIFDCETSGTNPWKDKVYCVSIWAGGKAFVIPFEHRLSLKVIPWVEFRDILGPLFNDPDVRLINHNVKFDGHFMREQLGIKVGKFYADTMTQAWTIDPTGDHGLKELSYRYGFGLNDGNYTKQFGKTAWSHIDFKLATYYACKDVEYVARLLEAQNRVLDRKKRLRSLFWDVEMPVLNISFAAEAKGMRVDEDYVNRILRPKVYTEYEIATETLRPFIEPHLEKGDTVNDVLQSPKKLNRIFFDYLGLPERKFVTLKKATKGPRQGEWCIRSLDKDAISFYKNDYPFMKLLGEWRKVSTVRKLFVDKLPQLVIDHVIHMTINTIGTATGRMSGKDPNFQQMPSRMGPLIRQMFVPDEGNVFISMDFSQQELRLMAHMTRDPKLIAYYEEGRDIYSETAYELFGHEEVGPLDTDGQKKASKHRAIAKILILGLGFGMGAKKFAKTVGISEAEGKQYFAKYHETYPGVAEYQAKMALYATKHGYIVTMLGRQRPLPHITSLEKGFRGQAERAAGNTPIQGSAADMTKLAAKNVQKLIDREQWPIRIALFVHDEIVYEANAKWAQQNQQAIMAIKNLMETALPLCVPMKSSIQYEPRWGIEAKIDEIDDDMADWLEEAA